MALVFATASFYFPVEANIVWTVMITVMSFFLTYMCIELEKYTRAIREENETRKYQFLIENGITEYYSDFTKIDFEGEIKGTRKIQLLIMYARGFVTRNTDAIRSFLGKDGSILELSIIEDDLNHPVYKYLTRKYEFTSEKLRDSIGNFMDFLLNHIAPHIHENSRIIVHFIDYLPTYSLYIFDTSAYITLYKTAPKRTNGVPTFKVEKTSYSDFFDFLSDDFTELSEHEKTKTITITRNNCEELRRNKAWMIKRKAGGTEQKIGG